MSQLLPGTGFVFALIQTTLQHWIFVVRINNALVHPLIKLCAKSHVSLISLDAFALVQLT